MSNRSTIAAIVEGHGEVLALPVLLRRIASEIFGVHDLDVPQPFRVPRNKMEADGELSRTAWIQSRRVAGLGGVLVVADSDDDDPDNLRRKLIAAAQLQPIEVCIAVREFEAWYLAGIESLRPHRDIRDDARYDRDPEAKRDAKGEMSKLMVTAYSPTLHQPAFASLLNLEQAQIAQSFGSLVTCVGRLLSK